MVEISRVTPHANLSHFTAQPGGIATQQGRIMGASAKRVQPPARVVEKAVEANVQRKRDPRPLNERFGSAQQTIQPMHQAEVLQRAQTIGAKLRSVTQQAASILRRPKGGGKHGIAALYLARSLVGEEEINEGKRVPLPDEEFSDKDRLADLVWETEDPQELLDLLKSALPGSEFDPHALLAQIRSLGRDQRALMDLLAGLQGIPSGIEERKTLRADIEDEIHELESSTDTREVGFFRWAHLAAKQPNPQEFLRLSADVAEQKGPEKHDNWVGLLRSILQGHPSGATSSETLKGTVQNLILGLGIEMRRIRFDKDRLLGTIQELQRVHILHSLIDFLLVLIREVDSSIKSQATA